MVFVTFLKKNIWNKHFNGLLIIILFLFSFFLGVYWLFIITFLMMLIYWSLLNLIFLIKKNKIKKTIKSILLFFYLFFLVIGIKLFVFDIYKIPSSSMENTLFPKDVIVVNKLKYGPKLPRSPFEIPLINIAFYLNKKARSDMNTNWWTYKRLSGTSTIKKGDVFVFDMKFGPNKKTTIVKRCMGTPGTTLKIINGNIYSNNSLFNSSQLVKNEYEFQVKNINLLYKKVDSLGVNLVLNESLKSNFLFKAILSKQDVNNLENLKLIYEVKRVTDTFSQTKNIFSKPLYTSNWNWDNYGPLKVPSKGMKIKLNSKNFELYSRLIKKYEKVDLQEIHKEYFIGNKKTESYTFKQNYYFMMGDNRKGSIDSRRWGMIPEEFIVGKVQCILLSNYQDEFRWDRLFKSVN